MKPTTPQQQPTSNDYALLRRTLLRLTSAQIILCVIVIAVVALVWYDLLNRLVEFGRHIDYSGLLALGGKAVALLQQYNPFFWWAVVALCTLIIAYFLYSFVQSTRRAVRRRLVNESTMAMLASQLSPAALEVLRWVWRDSRDPVTVGDLQRTASELRNGRARKIQLARSHAALLAQAPAIPSPLSPAPVDPLADDAARAAATRAAAAPAAAVRADPVLTNPASKGSVPAGPVPADPVLADPVPVDSVRAEPVLTDPVLTDPVLTDSPVRRGRADPASGAPGAGRQSSK